MKKAQLSAQIREKSRQINRQIRSEGQVPAVLYGKNLPNINLKISESEISHLIKEFGQHALIDLTTSDTKIGLVFLKSIQRDPVEHNILHVDLWKIDPGKEIETEIPVEPKGEAPAIKELEGILIQGKNELLVLAKPDDLISQIEIDISQLKTFEDKIQVKDIIVPVGITILNEPEETIFSIQEPRSEEELAELEEKPEENVEAVEVGEKVKEEEEDDNTRKQAEESNSQTPESKE